MMARTQGAHSRHFRRSDKCLERIDGGIYTTQSFARHSVEFSIRELSLWIVDENMQNIGGCSVSECIRITEWDGESNV